MAQKNNAISRRKFLQRSAALGAGGRTKRCNYSNPELDKLIDEEQKVPDTKKRIVLLQHAGKILMEDAPSCRSTISRRSTASRRIWRGR